MIRLGKLTDYGVIIMSQMASQPTAWWCASEISEKTGIALPTVSKLLKKLANTQLLASKRGSHGGYQLSRAPQQISIAEIVEKLEGPIAVTECNLGMDHCQMAMRCSLRSPWTYINSLISQTLHSVSLSDMINATRLAALSTAAFQ